MDAARRDPFASLRGFLALWIVLGHLLLHERYGTVYDAGFARHEDFGALGQFALLHFLGVDLFFMLSGLVLTLHYFPLFTSATTGREIDRFYLHRLRRLWPMHGAMIAIIGLFALTNIPHPISSHLENPIFSHWQWTLFLNLTLMNAWGFIPVASWNEPAWSLSILFFLSVLFPNLLLLLKRLPPRPWAYTTMILLLITGFAGLRSFTEITSYSDGMGGLIRGLVFFSAGCALGCYQHHHKTVYAPLKYAPWIFLLMVAVWTYFVPFPLTLFHLAYPLLLLGLQCPQRLMVPAAVSHWLGTRSFAVFMTHYPTLLAIRYFLGERLAEQATASAVGKYGSYLLVLTLIFIVAEIAYQLFDRSQRSRQRPNAVAADRNDRRFG